MRILVLWANEAQPNLGVSALGAGARTLALRAFPDAEISFHSTGGTDLPGNDGPIIITVPKSLFAGFLLNRRGFRTWLRSFDLILDTRAGDSFASIYGMKRLVTMSILPLMARILRVPIVLMPQTIGPFESVTARGIARVVMRSASAVMVRDVGSVRAAEELGVEPDALATDVVFSLPRPERRPEHDVLLNVSGLLWADNPHVDSVLYRRTVRAVIDGLEADGRKVALLEHSVDNGTDFDNDAVACRELNREYGDRFRVLSPSTVTEVRETVAGAQLVIGARMHACLNSLSTGTPTIPMAYSRKFAPLFEGLDWPRTVDLRTEADPAQLILEHARADLQPGVQHSLSIAESRTERVVEVLRAVASVSATPGTGHPS